MSNLISELKRRNVFKVAVGYSILGWVVLQVADVVVPVLELPEWTLKFVLFVGLLGFPFALFFAWAYELTPDGLKRDDEVSTEESITSETGKKINYAITALLVVAIGFLLWERQTPDNGTNDTVVAQQELDAATASETTTSIAVMPFVNMSADPDQEYFSDGISEEILNVLAQVPKLHVTSRSSAFTFKNSNLKLSEIAKQLQVSNILEGSIRKSGNRIRITAQLIEAETDKHLWSETFDRELDDIFAIQDEISHAIVLALKDKLNLGKNYDVRATTSINLEAHNEYLRGRHFLDKREKESLTKALSYFENSIGIEPLYASAWAGKAWTLFYLSEYQYGDLPIKVANDRALFAVNKAIELDDQHPEAYAIRGLITGEASDYDKSIELNPNLAVAYMWSALRNDKTISQSIELIEKAYELDPLSTVVASNYATTLSAAGEIQKAWQILNQIESLDPDGALTISTKYYLYSRAGEFGKSVYYRRVFLEKYPDDALEQARLANRLNALGLLDEAIYHVEKSNYVPLKYLIQNNVEYFITQVRQQYPMADDDVAGLLMRGRAELLDGNLEQ
ncbi:MAG: hypothetical protein KJO69_03660, partial [Gammaproteobacteria bacterium]|nr:hypothetical protein [Gammaproteobacteria bacterium]